MNTVKPPPLPPPPPNPDDGGGRRKPVLNDAFIKKAVELTVAGNFRIAVARAMGISPRTFRVWMARGRDAADLYPDGPYARLYRGVTTAEAEFESLAVGRVMDAGKEDASHIEWVLSRRFPERWGVHRGETGEIKRQNRQKDEIIAELRDDIRELRQLLGVDDAAEAGNPAAAG